MTGGPETESVVGVGRLMEDADMAVGGVLWKLTASVRQLDANVVCLPPGKDVGAHVEDALDVLLCVTHGGGDLRTDTYHRALEPGDVISLPRGTRRALHAGEDGLVYLSVHRRRPGLSIDTSRVKAAEAPGGEDACFLHRVCVRCDRPASDRHDRYCGRCGHPLPD